MKTELRMYVLKKEYEGMKGVPPRINETWFGTWPANYYELEGESVLDMTTSQLNTIDTFQNANRGFKEDKNERFRNY